MQGFSRVARRAVVGTLVTALTLQGCYGKPGELVPRAAPIKLVVDNRGYFDVTVYAARSDGSPGTRLGTAGSLGMTTFRVPATALQANGTLIVRLHAIGSIWSWVSPSVSVSEGDEARLEVYASPDGRLGRSQLYAMIPRDAR